MLEIDLLTINSLEGAIGHRDLPVSYIFFSWMKQV